MGAVRLWGARRPSSSLLKGLSIGLSPHQQAATMSPITRSAARAARVTLLSLPDELLEAIARSLIATNDMCAAVHLCGACSKEIAVRLEMVKVEAEARRLRWLPDITRHHTISDHGRTALFSYDHELSELLSGWTAGGPLPTAGVSSWKVQVVGSEENVGYMRIGVCTNDNKYGWGFNLFSGKLYCQPYIRYPLSEDILAGYPRGQGTQILFVGGQPSNLQESAIGTMVEVHVDHGAGTLGFCINGGPYVEAIKGFPPDVLLRPWALCLMPEDSVRFVGFLSTRC